MTGPAPPRPSVGDLIRERRQRAQMSLRDLASVSKVSNAYLSQVERGLHQPSVRVLRAIADALELSSEQMMSLAGLGRAPDEGVAATGGPTPAERAITADERLSENDRRTLLELYRRLAGLSD